MSHLRAYASNSCSTAIPRRPRKIEEFSNPLEFLQAMHDAVESHGRQFMNTGEAHGNINTNTVYIGSPSINSTRMGFITGPGTAVNPIFQSANVLAKAKIEGRQGLPKDYLDDLESFYYIIAWVSMAYTAPGQCLPVKRFPHILACWAADPDSKDAALTKEALLRGGGFDCRIAKLAIFDKQGLPASDIFEALLGLIHLVLKDAYNEKWDKWDVCRQAYLADRTSYSKVYAWILDYLKRAARAMATSVEPNPEGNWENLLSSLTTDV